MVPTSSSISSRLLFGGGVVPSLPLHGQLLHLFCGQPTTTFLRSTTHRVNTVTSLLFLLSFR